jgi:hypothetical protein
MAGNRARISRASRPGKRAISPVKIHALGIMQGRSSTRGRAIGDVDGVESLETCGTTLMNARKAWQAKADQLVVHREEEHRHA